ncbi:GIY-YIG nuclease [Pannonibacter phragmitetus]|uniref:GIY-YIG nuclease family protein n=1 Tax=Pannonibacter phragmitetus TaxID=121719 RepID=UPI00067C64A7|nr:GIY-YIG nuclease family protein [Pannonibacter phragmitetus]KND20499.1 GIY-YIG nuclease [Pannonibacter phragmitetus]
MPAWVYIMASKPYETLYTGVTADLARRVYEHREGEAEGFTERYGIKSLVWYQEFATMNEAIAMEKKIKRWRRQWKFDLIEKGNPQWRDLYPDLNR